MLNDEHSTPGGAIIFIVDAREEKTIELEIGMREIVKDLQLKMFKKLVENNIVVNNDGHYACYSCTCIKASLEDILHHIDREEHTIARCDQIFKMFKHYNITETYQEIRDKKKTAYVIAEYVFICIPCQKSFKYLFDVLEHFESEEHTKKFQNNITNFDEISLKINMNNRKVLRELEIDETNVFDRRLLKNLIAYPDYDLYINKYEKILLSKLFKKEDDYYEILVNNKVILLEYYMFNFIISDKGTYKCDLCLCSLSHVNDILSHINSKRHRVVQDLKKIHYEINKDQKIDCDEIQHVQYNKASGKEKCKMCNSLIPCDKSIELVKQELLDNKITYLGNIFSCTICDYQIVSHQICPILQHIKGESHRKKFANLNTYESTSSNNTMVINISENHNIYKNNKLSSDNQCDFGITEDVRVQIINTLHEKQISKICKPEEKSVNTLERLNNPCTEKYFKIEKKMYSVQEKLNNIKIYLRLIVPRDSIHFYCLACNQEVLKELYFVYEHICLQKHKMQVNQIKKDINCDKLSGQYMKEISKYRVECYPCGNIIKNDISDFTSHIEKEHHKKEHKEVTKVIDTIFDSISQHVNNLWSNIRKYCCALCSERFDSKVEFIQHINQEHSPLLEDQIFDFCISCTVLWLGKENCYTEHCNDKLHKYLLRSKDFIIKNLPKNIKEILTQVDKISNVLFQQSQDLSDTSCVSQEIKQSLENSLKSIYPTIKAFIYGSRVTGLALKHSDIDIYLDCDNTYNQKVKDYALAKSHLRTIEENLSEDEWEIKELLTSARTPIIKLIYKRYCLHCDISVMSGLSVENSKLIRSFNDAYLPCRKLTLFVKKWLSQCILHENRGLISYALSCLVIFYLQTESYLPSVAELIKEKNNSKLILGWETGVAQPKDNNKSEQPISTLLLGFFKFYANFDYRYYIICPLMGKPVAKKDFTDIEMLPEEMKPYYLRISKKQKYFRIHSPLYVQDPFELSHNLTKAVTTAMLKQFRRYCQDSSLFLSSLIK
ncbi:Speckle targeted PIP5K1A-regulated poly(A) polymerase [Melipona quadrifasciata]|uniref:Speckle targeted PIP5K1A-regulated poly(A) polymerase n=1 Tax=Melipona quadrifasciata TaxID=166423 RepID=A0A0N0U6L8_9HYME|nr:Speckle targeted PIP5K1A-regulated poly(A) polymerase [Melipona quadrifasciata]